MSVFKRVHPALLGAIFYGAVAIVTFGHSAANRYYQETVELAECKARPKSFCYDMRGESAAMNAIVAGMFWPFYLSWEAFQ